jgi:hypothetical protein
MASLQIVRKPGLSRLLERQDSRTTRRSRGYRIWSVGARSSASATTFIHTGGHFQDLNSLIPAGSGFELTDATSINRFGQIVANAYTTNGQRHALLLKPS